MKFVIIGDIHGRDYWMDFVEKNQGAHFVFLGDYVDPYDEDIDDYDALDNFNMILDYKKKNPNNVTLIIGNHDTQYIYYPKYATGALTSNEKTIETIKIFRNNKKHLQFAYQKGNNLFTHAGISQHWYNYYKDVLIYFGLKENNSNLADVINKMGNDSSWRDILMDVSNIRGGVDLYGGPLWSDRYELFGASVDNLNQFSGHNKMKDIWTNKNGRGSITFCDVLSSRKKCLIKNL